MAYARGREDIKAQVDGVLKKLDVPITALFSTLGRTAARGLEASWSAHKMKYFHQQLLASMQAGDMAAANIDKWEPASWPAEAKGVAPCEAPRGALAHWVKIKNQRIDNYQCVVPTMQRRDDLRRLRATFKARLDAMNAALQADFGHRSRHESTISDGWTVLKTIDQLLSNLKSWMRPQSRSPGWLMLPARAEVRPMTLGVVGVMAPWNYPVNLALVPLATAIAAGNSV